MQVWNWHHPLSFPRLLTYQILLFLCLPLLVHATQAFSHYTHWDFLVSSPDHTLYASSKRGPGVIHQFSWACRATPPMWKHMINIHRWLKPSTVLCTVNCKLRPMWENTSRQHWRWFSQNERERVGLQSNFPEPSGKQTKTSLSQ